MKYQRIIDISLPIYEGMITYPGNPEVVIETIQGKHSRHAKITLGSHSGTHIDAPSHVFEGAKGIEGFDLAQLMGECRVFDMTSVSQAIRVADLEPKNINEGERILVKTKNSLRGFGEFYDDYVYLDPDAAEFLASKGITFFGIDALSVKKRGSDDARSHTALLQKNIVILEGLNLANVKEGQYDLLCLPLKFEGVDGAPCRALLLA